jgi:hypothetical protein
MPSTRIAFAPIVLRETQNKKNTKKQIEGQYKTDALQWANHFEGTELFTLLYFLVLRVFRCS